jgi:hypothetical protein
VRLGPPEDDWDVSYAISFSAGASPAGTLSLSVGEKAGKGVEEGRRCGADEEGEDGSEAAR